MALTKELLKILDNTEEPLTKRLKIADNAFKSIELPIQHREAILIRWLGKVTKTNEIDVWNLLFNWLTSPQMQDLSRNDITRDDVQNLINVIIKRTKHADSASVVKCVTALIENRNFQQYFKYDLELYCKLIATMLEKLDAAQLRDFIGNEQLFNRNLVSNDEFYKCFMENCLITLACIATKFKDDKTMFRDLSKVVEKCLFNRNFKSYSAFLKARFEPKTDSTEKPSVLPKMLVKNLRKCYNAEGVYKLVFHAFCVAYGNNFDVIYKFFIVMVEILGFDASLCFINSRIKKFSATESSFDRSIAILIDLCQVLIENTNDLSLKVNDVTFSEFIQRLTTTTMTLSKHPNADMYELLGCIIIIDPLAIEKILKDVLVYVMLSNKDGTKAQYDKFLVSVFEVFAKLHRIPNLISTIIRTIKVALEGNFKSESKVLIFKGVHDVPSITKCVVKDVLPTNVLSYFTQCIMSLASWQVMKLFKTVVFHLEEAVDTDLVFLAESKIVYIEMISTLMCQFLGSVRIAEHTVSTVIVEKFVKTMDELKEILGKFGSTLVNMEHNPTLMRAYLNICCSWGELYITLAYYSINGQVILQKTIDSDSSACNITYLHPYLTRDQWCLISQRIANFGEKPCKQIMHKLYIQKLRAMLLFEDVVAEEILSSIRTSIISSIDDNWKEVIFDQLVLDQIVTKSSNITHIAGIILKDLIETNNFQQLSPLFNSNELVGSMLYVCLKQLNKAFRRKHKRGQPPVRISLTSKFFPYIAAEFFVQNDNENIVQITDVFVKELGLGSKSSSKDVISCVNEKDLSGYLDVIRAIPVVQYDNTNVRQVLILYLMCVLWDLKHSTLEDAGLLGKCESVIIGLTQNYNCCLTPLVKPFQTTQIIINLFTRYVEIFTFIAGNVFRREETLETFKEGVEFLAKNIEHERCLQCATVALNYINKHKKSKFSAEAKARLVEYEEAIVLNVFDYIKQQEVPDVTQSTEAYALTLKHQLMKNTDEFVPYLDRYVDGIIEQVKDGKEVRGGVELFTTILRHKSKFKVHKDIVVKTWSFCQNVNMDDAEQEDYSKLVILIFEHIPNEQFSDIANDLLRVTAQKLSEDTKQFTDQLKIWNAILSCNFNTTKTKIWQQVLETLLFETILPYLRDERQAKHESIYEDVVRFEANIIQNVFLILTAPLVEAMLITVSVMTSNTLENFTKTFGLSISLLETLLKFRKAIIMDYLPMYLQRFRALLDKLCAKSNSDLKLETDQVQQLSDCSHKLEKLTRSLVGCNRHLMRISPYLIADILKQYEEITLYPNVKIHLNNCLYSLMSLCDQHAIAYLMRVLSTASTEMFKVMFENYRKYYKFTGKV